MNEPGNIDPTVRQDSKTPTNPPTPTGQGALTDALLGKVIDGRFKLRMVLGEGGMGRVYLAEDQKLNGRRVAIKMMGASINSDAEFRARFAREAILQANLPHPQIVQILDIGECPEGSYIVMEYSSGRSLSRVVKELGPRGVEQACRLAEQVLHVLDFAHGQGVVHRDLKPSNILVEERAGKEHVKLLDFGIAKLLGPHGESEVSNTLTKAGFAYGTLGYMAPEQACGDLSVMDHRADLYAVGVILYEMLTGHVPAPPESRTHPVRYAMWVQQSPIPTLAESHPTLGVDDGLDAVIQKALDRQPENRYQTALAFIQDLRDVREGSGSRTVRSAPVGRAQQQNRNSTRSETVAVPATSGLMGKAALPWALMVLALIGCAALAFKAFGGSRTRSEGEINARADFVALENSVLDRLKSLSGADVSDVEAGFKKVADRVKDLSSQADPETFKQLEADLKASQVARDALTIQRDDATAAVITAQRERSELVETARATAKQISDMETAHREAKSAWDQEKALLKGQLEAAKVVGRSDDERIAEIAELTRNNSLLDSQLKTALNDWNEVKAKLQKLESDHQQLRNDLATAKGDADRYKGSYDSSYRQLQETRDSLSMMRGTLTAREQRISDLERELAARPISPGGTSPVPSPGLGSNFNVSIFNRRPGVQQMLVQEIIAISASGQSTTLPNPRDNIAQKASDTISVPTGTVSLRITHAELDTSKRPRRVMTTTYTVNPSVREIYVE